DRPANRRPAGPPRGRKRIDQSVTGTSPQLSTAMGLSGGLPHFHLLKRAQITCLSPLFAAAWLCCPEPSMIPRYTRPEMAAIWEPQTRFKIWFEIEAHAADALAELGVIPKEAAATIWAKGRDAVFNVARIDEIERETKHDVIAFLTH